MIREPPRSTIQFAQQKSSITVTVPNSGRKLPRPTVQYSIPLANMQHGIWTDPWHYTGGASVRATASWADRRWWTSRLGMIQPFYSWCSSPRLRIGPSHWSLQQYHIFCCRMWRFIFLWWSEYRFDYLTTVASKIPQPSCWLMFFMVRDFWWDRAWRDGSQSSLQAAQNPYQYAVCLRILIPHNHVSGVCTVTMGVISRVQDEPLWS